MTTDAEVACPDPNCPTRLPHHPHRQRRFSHAETTAVPLPSEPEPMQRIELAPDYHISRLIRGGWQLAGGHGAVDRERGGRRHGGLRRRRHHHLRLRRHLHRRRGADRRLPRAPTPTCAARGARAHQGAHQVRARPRRPAAGRRAPTSSGIIDRSLRRLGAERLDLVQFHWWDYAVPGWLEAAQLARRAAARRQDPPPRRHQLRHRAHGGDARRRRAAASRMQVQYSLLDRRPGERRCVPLAAARGVALLCYGTVAGGFLGDRWLGRPEPARAAREPLADQVQADHRRLRRLGPVPGAAAALRRVADRHGSDIATVASAGCSTGRASPR